MRKFAVALAAGAISVAVAAPAASAEPNAQSCQGGLVSSSVQPSALGPGRRAVATFFFGDDPHAVQTGAQAVKEFCSGQ
jgi:hypothetical protein